MPGGGGATLSVIMIISIQTCGNIYNLPTVDIRNDTLHSMCEKVGFW